MAATTRTPRSTRPPGRLGAAVTRRSHAGFAGLALVVLIGTFFGAGIPSLQDRAPELTDILLGLLATLTLLPGALALLRETGDILEPLSVTGGLFFLYFALRATFLLYGSPDLGDLSPRLGYSFHEFVVPALEFTIACWVAAMVGYYLPFGRLAARQLPAARRLEGDINQRNTLLLFGIGALFRMIQVARGTHLAFAKNVDADPSTQSYVDLGSSLDLVALFLLSAQYFRGKLDLRTRTLLFAVVLPETLLFGFISGSKWLMLQPLITMLAASHYLRSKLGLRHGVVLVALLVFVAIPLGQAMRSSYGETNDSVTDFSFHGTTASAEMAASRVRDTVADDSSAFVESALRSTTSRMHGLDSVMVALKMTPDFIPWVDPAPYYLAPLMAVAPRILWKNKPIADAVPRWATDYWGARPSETSSIATTHIGALYLAFGWFGSAVAMLLLGMLWRIIYEYPLRFRGPISWCLYYFQLLSVIRIENDIPTVYVGLTKVLALFVIVVWAAGVRPAREHQAPRPSRAVA